MKNLSKTFALAVLIFGVTLSAWAIDEEKLNTANVENVVDAYINTTIHGDVTYIDEVFAQTFKQRFNTEHDQPDVSRSPYIKQLKRNRGITFECDSDYKIIEQLSKYSLVKVSLDFGDFTRTDYITLVNTDGGWEITEVNTAFD